MRRPLAPFALLLLGFSPVLAQGRLEAPDTAMYPRWGSIRARPGLELSNVGYDNNILRLSDQNPSGKIGDYTATISPRVELLTLMGPRAFLIFRQQFDYTVYANYFDQNYLNNRSQIRAVVPFVSDFGVFVDGSYKIRHDRPPDLEAARPRQNYFRLASGFILEPGWRTEIEIAATAEDFEYEDSNVGPGSTSFIAERLNRSELGTSISVGYKVLSRTAVVFDGVVKTIRFDDPFTIEDLPSPGERTTLERDTREWRALGGLRWAEGAPLTGQILVGWNKIKPDDPRIQTLSVPIGNVRLAYRLSSLVHIELNGERRTGFSVYGANSYFLYSDIELRTVNYFNRVLGLEVAVGAGRLTFPSSLNLLGREDDVNRYELALLFRQAENSIGKRTEYSLRLRHLRRQSSVAALSRSDTIIGFGAVFGY